MKDIQELVKTGKSQGFINYLDFIEHIPLDVVDADQIEDIIQMLNDMGIEVLKNKAEIIQMKVIVSKMINV